MCRGGLVYATATEDMDALTFGTPRLVRHMTFSAARKLPIVEVDLEKVLHGLGLSMEAFVELSILCGCDYTSSIRGKPSIVPCFWLIVLSLVLTCVNRTGIGPLKAFKLMKKYGTIEDSLKHLDEKKYPWVLATFHFGISVFGSLSWHT